MLRSPIEETSLLGKISHLLLRLIHWEKSYSIYKKNIIIVANSMKYQYLQVFLDFQPIHDE